MLKAVICFHINLSYPIKKINQKTPREYINSNGRCWTAPHQYWYRLVYYNPVNAEPFLTGSLQGLQEIRSFWLSKDSVRIRDSGHRDFYLTQCVKFLKKTTFKRIVLYIYINRIMHISAWLLIPLNPTAWQTQIWSFSSERWLCQPQVVNLHMRHLFNVRNRSTERYLQSPSKIFLYPWRQVVGNISIQIYLPDQARKTCRPRFFWNCDLNMPCLDPQNAFFSPCFELWAGFP